MGRAGHASCARSMLGANAIPSDNASPPRCFMAFSFCLGHRQKQVSCRLPEVFGAHGWSAVCSVSESGAGDDATRSWKNPWGAVSGFPSSANSPEDEARLRARGSEYGLDDVDFRLITSWRGWLFPRLREAFPCAPPGLPPPSAS